MSRFYVPKENVKKDEIMIDGKEAHHILDVMRMAEGDKIVAFDGTGCEYSGFIKKIDQKSKIVTLKIVRTERPAPESAPEVVLAQAVPKQNKMDFVIEKATELGAKRIIPVITQRTIARPSDGSKKVQRWRKLALASSKQCGRRDVPKIEKVTLFKEVLSLMPMYDLVLMACLKDETIPLKKALDGFEKGKVLILIGPEGDFTPQEIEAASKDNCRFVSLGKRVLRSETAGLFMLSALEYEFSE